METIETFVTASVHTSQGGARFIRCRFQVGAEEWLTAFNPKGVKDVEWVRRTNRATGKQRIQSRFPVKVRFTRSSVVGSDVVDSCIIAPRDFTPKAMEAADEADLEALGVTAATPAPAMPATPAPTGEEPLA